jgi:Uma2 family endonuclease
MPLLQQGKQYTYADYLTWPEDERWEIIDGVPYMQATPTPLHQEISGNLFVQFHQYLSGKPCKIYLAPFSVILSQNEKNEKEIKNVVEPDITIICDKSKIDDKGCKGTPDMIIEIISPSSIKKDRITKFNKYEKVGVLEYWIVEPEQKIISLFALQKDQAYGRPKLYTDEDKITSTIFPDLTIDLNEIFNT